LTDAKSDMMTETVSDVQMKCWMGCFGALAAEFPTVPGTARLIDYTGENRTKRAAAFSENFKKIFGEACAPLDKILSLIQTNENFCVGEELTLADIHLVKLYVFSKDLILENDFEKNCPKTFKVVEEFFVYLICT
jgi:glutathione S-transferase